MIQIVVNVEIVLGQLWAVLAVERHTWLFILGNYKLFWTWSNLQPVRATCKRDNMRTRDYDDLGGHKTELKAEQTALLL